MAITKDLYISRFNLTIPDCYWKLDSDKGILGGKQSLLVTMNCFKDKPAADTNTNGDLLYFVLQFSFNPDLQSADNFFKQAYTYAKTLPELTGGADV
jgi:hypothetical protein